MANYIKGQAILKAIEEFIEAAKEEGLALQFEIRDETDGFLGGMDNISPYAVNIDPNTYRTTINGFVIPLDSDSLDQWEAVTSDWYYLYLTNNETPEVSYVLIKGD